MGLKAKRHGPWPSGGLVPRGLGPSRLLESFGVLAASEAMEVLWNFGLRGLRPKRPFGALQALCAVDLMASWESIGLQSLLRRYASKLLDLEGDPQAWEPQAQAPQPQEPFDISDIN